VRRFDDAENSSALDFVLHGGEGVASNWARLSATYWRATIPPCRMLAA
jgi:NADPH-dependent ferric siderophore reductase